jgi:hypothetical protein
VRIHSSLLIALLGLVASGATAAERTFKDWSVALSDNSEYLFAATMNDSGEVLGEFCYFATGTCNWVLGMKTECEEDSEYPFLANSSSGARHLEVSCVDAGDGHYVYGFAWKEIEAVIKGAAWVGLALPMNGDAFKVVRFSLRGVDESTSFLEDVFQAALKSGTGAKRNTKSTIM